MPNLHLTLDEKWRICSTLTRSDAGERSWTHIDQEGHYNHTQIPGSLLHVPFPTCIQKFLSGCGDPVWLIQHIGLAGRSEAESRSCRDGSRVKRIWCFQMVLTICKAGSGALFWPFRELLPCGSQVFSRTSIHSHKIRIINLKRKAHQLHVQS